MRLLIAVAMLAIFGASARAQCPNGQCPRPVYTPPVPRQYALPARVPVLVWQRQAARGRVYLVPVWSWR